MAATIRTWGTPHGYKIRYLPPHLRTDTSIYDYLRRRSANWFRLRLIVPFQPRISQQVLLHLVLFEMFHHEFYHHLV
jgi:hypothetical protein